MEGADDAQRLLVINSMLALRAEAKLIDFTRVVNGSVNGSRYCELHFGAWRMNRMVAILSIVMLLNYGNMSTTGIYE